MQKENRRRRVGCAKRQWGVKKWKISDFLPNVGFLGASHMISIDRALNRLLKLENSV